MKSSFLHIPPCSVFGIDPDVDKNGVACLDVQSNQLELQTLPFPEMIELFLRLKSLLADSSNRFMVIIEAGWLNHTHWHTKWGDSSRVAAARGNSVGRNHEVGRKLAEMCEYWGIPYQLVKPLRKMWRGHDGKITAKELEAVTAYQSRSNQESRDAALLAWSWRDR